MAKSPEIAKHSSDTTSFSPSQSSSSPVPQSPPSSAQDLAKSPPDCNCMKNTYNKPNSMKQQNTVVPDKIPDLTNMQGMVLVLVLTILKLLHHPKCRPRLSYVPAPFPSQSYSDIETTNSTTTKPSNDIIRGKRSLLSLSRRPRYVVWCGNVRGIVKKVVLGCKTGLLEKVNILRSGSAQVIRVCTEKVSGKMIDYGQCVENYGQKIVKKIEPTN